MFVVCMAKNCANTCRYVFSISHGPADQYDVYGGTHGTGRDSGHKWGCRESASNHVYGDAAVSDTMRRTQHWGGLTCNKEDKKIGIWQTLSIRWQKEKENCVKKNLL